MDYAAMGRRIRTRRHALRLTQEELAGRASISTSFLGHIERGSRVASIETLVQLCCALNTTPNEVLGAEGWELSSDLPERLVVSAPSLLQGIADLLKNQQLPE